jgi:excisionase family DNA binding protein
MERPPKILYTRAEAAWALGFCVATLVEAIRVGMIDQIRQGSRLLIHRDELERFAREPHEHIWAPKENGRTVRRAGKAEAMG